MREIGSALYAFMDKYLSWIDKPKIGPTDIIEIIIIAFVLYHVMVWVKNTRAWMLFKGIIVILIFLLLAALFQMNTILWLSGKCSGVGPDFPGHYFSAGVAKCTGTAGQEEFSYRVF